VERDRLSVSGAAVPVLLIIIALDVSLALYEAAWGPGLGMLPWLLVASVTLSLFLVRSVLQPWALHLASAASGALLALAGSSIFVFSRVPLLEGVELTLQRLGTWLEAVRLGMPTQDPLPFSVVLAVSLWLGFHFCTWLIYREGKVWWAVVAPAVALMLTSYYSPDIGSGYVVIYAFCALLLIVRVSVQSLTDDWRRARLPHDRTVGDDFMIDAGYIVAAVLVVAWLLPPAALEQRAANLWVRFERPWRQAQQRWNELFPTTGAAGTGAPHSAIFGDSLVMGGAVQLGADRLFEVNGVAASRMQAAIYDLYDGRQWWAAVSAIALMEPDDFASVRVYNERVLTEQTVRVLYDTRTLIAATMPLAFDVPIKSEHLVVESGATRDELELYAATAREVMAPGEVYRAQSAVSKAAEEQLRNAGYFYPRWVTETYLGLPDTLPERVQDLALEVSAASLNPYDQALALEAYLRTTLTYETDITAPPSGRDAVDYFLFDSQEGYCNYFSSAMVVMARSLGIPARVVAGYAPGVYQPGTDSWLITASEAHSWPQLYFPRYGWVDFEPTPAQPMVVRPEPPQPAAERTPGPAPAGPSGLGPSLPEELDLPGGGGALDLALPQETSRWPLVAAAAVLVMALSVYGFWYLPRRRMWPAERVYSDLIAAARLLGVRPRRSETPLEYSDRVSALVPEAADDVQTIVRGFCRVRYAAEKDAPIEEGGWLHDAGLAVRAAIMRTAPRLWAERLGVAGQQ